MRKTRSTRGLRAAARPLCALPAKPSSRGSDTGTRASVVRAAQRRYCRPTPALRESRAAPSADKSRLLRWESMRSRPMPTRPGNPARSYLRSPQRFHVFRAEARRFHRAIAAARPRSTRSCEFLFVCRSATADHDRRPLVRRHRSALRRRERAGLAANIGPSAAVAPPAASFLLRRERSERPRPERWDRNARRCETIPPFLRSPQRR